jgi:phage tail-like protein
MPKEPDFPAGSFQFHLVFRENHLGGGAGGGAERPLAGGAFAECTGLEATHEPKVIREGGFNYGVHQRAGTTTFATVILRRGITANDHLWRWFEQTTQAGGYAQRLDVEIEHLDLDGTRVRAWQLRRAMPVKFKSGDLNARSGEVAIEELHLAHEGLSLRTT